MRRTVIIGAACALLVSAVAWATQLWRDNQSGADAYSLSHITSLQVNNGAGSGTRCAQFDSAGNLLPASAACSAGLGGASGVTSATGTAQRVSVTPTTGAVIVDTIGGYYSGAVSGGNEDLGTTLTNGLVCDTTTAGVAVLRTCSAGTDYVASVAVTGPIVNNGTAANPNIGVALPDAQVAYGLSGTNVTSSSKMTYVDANPLFLLNNGIGTSTVWVDAGTAAAQGGGFFRAYSVGFPVPSLSQSVAFGNDTGAGSLGVTVFGNSVSASGGAGYVSLRGGGYDTGAENILCDKNGAHLEGSVFDSALTTNGLMKTTGGTGLHATATAGTDYQAPISPNSCGANTFATSISGAGALTCTQPAFSNLTGTLTCGQSEGPWTGDVSKAANSCATALVNIPNDVPQAGDILVTNSVAPSTPAAGKTRCYVDSTSKNGACKNDAGTVNHGIQTVSCSAHQWVSAISDAGGSACVQPAFTDVSGSVSCAQLPALTGAVTTSAGSCATTLASLAGKTPQTMFWSWNLATIHALNNQFLCEGNYNVGSETCNQYPVLQTFTHVTMSLNITTNTCTGGGSPLFQMNITKNGSGLVNLPVSCGTTGLVTTGSVAFAAAAGDVIGLVYDGTLFGTGAGGGTSAFVTTRFDP